MTRKFALLLVTLALLVPGAPAQAAPDNYTPRPGVTFNSPLGDSATRQAIFRKILRAINSTPRGSDISIFSWNFLTKDGATALLRAQARGVRVRLLIDDTNNTEFVNQPYRRLKAGLIKGNEGRPHSRRSWARACTGSCRGRTGSAHSKFFLFSQVGNVKRVVMQGSANLTLASTNNQWNDIYIHTRSLPVWRFANRIFDEAARDEIARRPFASRGFGEFRLIMFPLAGKGARDPVMTMLNKVKCLGATNTPNGRTQLRIAPDVIRQNRGMRLAKKVRSLWQSGCDIKVGYTVVGIDIGRMLRSSAGRGPVPMKHLVQDFNDDGEFDNYFHLKSMSIVGNYNGDRSGYALLNGSANWSGLAAVSDENLGIYGNKRVVLQYHHHLDYWYNNFPAPRTQLVFGSGARAVYEDGRRVAVNGVNPFARVETD